MKNIVGIDISKNFFDSFVNGKVINYSNDKKGFQRFVNELSPNSKCIMESTGSYGYKLVEFLIKAGHEAFVVNPLSVKNFARMKLKKTKTDKIDAKLLTEYGKMNIEDLQAYQFSSTAKQAETAIEQLIKQKTALLNQIEALEHLANPDKMVLKTLKDVIATLNIKIKELQDEVEKGIKQTYPEVYSNILSIKGIGVRTACYLIALTDGFINFQNAKQLSSYFGCCPQIIESGSSVRPRNRLSRIGFSRARTLLYLCGFSASRTNNACKNLYERLIAKGKAKKMALMAVVNKLIHQIFGVVKNNTKFENSYQH
jgi:transposase